MKKLTFIGIILSLLLGLGLWQQQHLVAAKAAPAATAAATFMVNSTINVPAGDENAFIAAINTANNETSNPGPDTISLAGGTYTFSTPHNFEYGPNALPPITSDITIEGNGAVLDSTATTRLRFL
jgi:hypothetical protein